MVRHGSLSWFTVMVSSWFFDVSLSWFRHGSSWFTVMVCHSSSWFTVMVCHGSTWFIMVRHGSLSWFVMVHCHGSSWFVMVRHGSLSWFVMVHCRGSSWFTVMVHHGSLSWFVMVRHGSLSWFRHGLSLFVMCYSLKFSRRSCDPLFSQSGSQIHYQISFLMRLLIFPFPFKEHSFFSTNLKTVQSRLPFYLGTHITILGEDLDLNGSFEVHIVQLKCPITKA